MYIVITEDKKIIRNFEDKKVSTFETKNKQKH